MLTVISYHKLDKRSRIELAKISSGMQIIELPYPASASVAEILAGARSAEHLILIAFCEKYEGWTDLLDARAYFSWKNILALVSCHGEFRVTIDHGENERGYVPRTRQEPWRLDMKKLPEGTIASLVERFHEVWRQPALL